MTEEQLLMVTDCIREGLPMREAAICAGLTPATMASMLQRGRKSKSGKAVAILAAVRAAQVDYMRQVHRGALKAARAGNPQILDRLLTRAAGEMSEERAESAVSDVPADPADAMRYRLADVRRRMADATGIAYTHLLRAERELVTDLERLTDVAPASDASDLTPEEWAARCVEDARASSDLDLDHYMAEWCRRHKLRLVVRAGEPVLVRDGLSLVSGGG